VEIQGKVAIVTGSSAGVGRATAELLARLGASVVVNYAHSEADAHEVVAAIESAGGTAHAFRADVAQDAECRALIQHAVDTYSRLDILVNNAGRTHFIDHADLDAVTDQVWDDILSVNVRGVFNCTRAAAPHLRASADGAVVNVASIAGLRGVGSSIPYAVSKAGVINLTRSLARVLAPEVRVNCIAPGFIDGRWLRGGIGDNYEAVRARAAENTPLKNVATPETCADAILGFIATNTFVTGQTLTVDGGASL